MSRALLSLLLAAVALCVLGAWWLVGGSIAIDAGGEGAVDARTTAAIRDASGGAPVPIDAFDADRSHVLRGPDAPAVLQAELAEPGADDEVRLTDRRPPEPPPDVMRRLTLDADGGVSGRVLDETGRRIGGAEVTLLAPGWSGEAEQRLEALAAATSAADGAFALALPTDLDPSFARVAVRAPGHGPWFGRLVVAGGAEDVVLPAPRRLRLRVRFEDGASAAGAQVQLAREAIDPHWLSTGTTHGVDEQTAATRRRDGAAAPEGGGGWFASTTDDDGLAWLALTPDATWTLVRVSHPESRGTRRVELPPDDDPVQAEVVLPRASSVEIVLEGDHDAWRTAGQRPQVALIALVPDGAGGLVPRTVEGQGMVQHSLSLDHDSALFVNLAPTPWRVTCAGVVLLEAFTPPPGRTVLRLPLPEPPPFDPRAGWVVRGAVVDAQGQPIDSALRSWGRLPQIRLEESGGDVGHTSVGSLVGGQRVWMLPPLRVSFEGWADGPVVTGVMPGTPLRLVVDERSLRDATAAIEVDLSGLDAAVRPEVLLDLSRTEGRWERAADPAHVGGLGPGEWRWSLGGPGVTSDEGRGTLLAGSVQRLIARPAPPPEPEERPPHAVVQGSVTILGDDPWVVPWRVELESVDAPAGVAEQQGPPQAEDTVHQPLDAWLVQPSSLQVSHGAFAGPLDPGRYRLRAVARRALQPERLVQRGLRPEDAWRQAELSLASDWVELELADGERRELAFEIDARALGLVFVEVFVEGLPLAEAGTGDFPHEVQVTLLDAAGSTICTDVLVDPPAGGVSYAVPPGRVRVSVESRGRADLASWSRTLVVPPAESERGPRALELRVDLRPRSP